MVQSFENENMISENMCEVFMNDVIEEEYEINPGLQTKRNQNPKMKKTKEKLQAQKTMWKSCNRNSLCWVFLCEQ
jgi:hypothetical protein